MEKEIICKCGLIKIKENFDLFPKSGNLCRKCDNIRIKKYYEKNKEKISKRRKEIRIQKNIKYKNLTLEEKEKRKKSCNNSRRKRRKKDKLYVFTERIRNSIRYGFRKNGFTKPTNTIEILGCSFEDFKIYIENLFEPWMNWENRGLYKCEFNYGWDIDHIIPISSAKTIEDIIRLNHYTNLQPLCSYVNRNIKKDKIKY
jgi:hypothetical protein